MNKIKFFKLLILILGFTLTINNLNSNIPTSIVLACKDKILEIKVLNVKDENRRLQIFQYFLATFDSIAKEKISPLYVPDNHREEFITLTPRIGIYTEDKNLFKMFYSKVKEYFDSINEEGYLTIGSHNMHVQSS